MNIVTLEELSHKLRPGAPLMGLDLGTKTIGIAVSDLGLRLANPRPLIERKKFSVDAQKLMQRIEEEKAQAVILGMPHHLDGSDGKRAQATRAFARNMADYTDLKFAYWDERLSTVAANQALLEMDVSRQQRARRIDSAAATFILQGTLDRLATLRSRSEPES